MISPCSHCYSFSSSQKGFFVSLLLLRSQLFSGRFHYYYLLHQSLFLRTYSALLGSFTWFPKVVSFPFISIYFLTLFYSISLLLFRSVSFSLSGLPCTWLCFLLPFFYSRFSCHSFIAHFGGIFTVAFVFLVEFYHFFVWSMLLYI